MKAPRNSVFLARACGYLAVLLQAGCGTVFPVLAPEGAEIRVSLEGRFVNMVDRSLFHEWADTGFGDPSALRKITAQYYDFFRDDAEILVITAPTKTRGGATIRIFNDTLGTGIPMIDRRSEFTADESLSMIISLYGRNELTIGAAVHELAHRWANGLRGDMELASAKGVNGGHWGFSDVHGQLGGWIPGSLEKLDDDLYRGVVAPSGYALTNVPYAPLELYLMGLLPASKVPGLTIAVGAEIVEMNLDVTTFRAKEFRRLTIDQIIEQNGERIPEIGAAPTNFTIAFIVLTADPLDVEQFLFYEKAIDFLTRQEALSPLDVFSDVKEMTPVKLEQDAYLAAGLEVFQNFYRATGGLGTLTLRTAAELRRPFGQSRLD